MTNRKKRLMESASTAVAQPDLAAEIQALRQQVSQLDAHLKAAREIRTQRDIEFEAVLAAKNSAEQQVQVLAAQLQEKAAPGGAAFTPPIPPPAEG